jgi:hypothetical protein
MEKTLQFKLKAPRLLRFVSEGHHKRTLRPYTDPLSNIGETSPVKPVAGFISYSYTVSYSWVSNGSALDPASTRVPLVTCPCGVGI